MGQATPPEEEPGSIVVVYPVRCRIGLETPHLKAPTTEESLTPDLKDSRRERAYRT